MNSLQDLVMNSLGTSLAVLSLLHGPSFVILRPLLQLFQLGNDLARGWFAKLFKSRVKCAMDFLKLPTALDILFEKKLNVHLIWILSPYTLQKYTFTFASLFSEITYLYLT